VFAEMLLASIWLYQDFPDVDLWVSTSDEPSRCNMSVPVMQFYVISPDGHKGGGGSGGGGGGSSGGDSSKEQAAAGVDVDQLLSGNGGWPRADCGKGSGGGGGGAWRRKGAKAEVRYTRGFPMVTADVGSAPAFQREGRELWHHSGRARACSGSGGATGVGWGGEGLAQTEPPADAFVSGSLTAALPAPASPRPPQTWEELSLPQASLEAYSACLRARHGTRQAPRTIWRGSNTGFNRGWPQGAACAPQPPAAAGAAWAGWRRLLYSKRALAALLSRGHDHMDVGLHAFYPELWDMKPGDAAAAAAQELLVRPPVPLEAWGRYAVQLSIDGHAGPFRLPRQYLSGTTVVLQMDSPFKSW
jgi:hypothetical protein